MIICRYCKNEIRYNPIILHPNKGKFEWEAPKVQPGNGRRVCFTTSTEHEPQDYLAQLLIEKKIRNDR